VQLDYPIFINKGDLRVGRLRARIRAWGSCYRRFAVLLSKKQLGGWVTGGGTALCRISDIFNLAGRVTPVIFRGRLRYHKSVVPFVRNN
jgi:hypothetical protein